jgi:hypothetical protein
MMEGCRCRETVEEGTGGWLVLKKGRNLCESGLSERWERDA